MSETEQRILAAGSAAYAVSRATPGTGDADWGRARVLAAAAEAVAIAIASEWQPIKSFQKHVGDAESVLLYCARQNTTFIGHMMEGGFYHTNNGAPIMHKVTHWQPLPEPPK